jgi:hypothetical protein
MVGGDTTAGLKVNLADLEFLLQSYRIDVEEVLMNQHLLTATTNLDTFFLQLETSFKGLVIISLLVIDSMLANIVHY